MHLFFLFKIYVHPQLEYCVQVWNPFLVKDIDLLEKVQRHATKCLHSFVESVLRGAAEKT